MTDNQNEIDIAIRFDVVIPETCEELAWEKETTFCWVYQQPDNGRSCDFWELVLSDSEVAMANDTIPAPQMHEIARELPAYIPQKVKTALIVDKDDSIKEKSIFDSFYLTLHTLNNTHKFGQLCYESPTTWSHKNISVHYDNHHYAQAYAELYLKLREAGFCTSATVL